MSRLSDYLELQTRDGRYESTGHFTIDVALQLEKLGLAQLSSDTHALLKLVQAVVGWGASDVQIAAGPDGVSVYGANVRDAEARADLERQTAGPIAPETA